MRFWQGQVIVMIKFTDEQQQIIDAPIDNNLVSAAAGSGKTTVLVERIINSIINAIIFFDFLF